MRLAVSNIAWHEDEDIAVAEALAERGVDALEVAPGRLFSQPDAASEADARRVRGEWEARGLSLIAMQALLFGRSDLLLFGEDDGRALSEYLARIIRLAGWLGCGPLVFGSPKNRQRGALSFERACERAADVLRPLARLAHEEGCTIALEPNAEAYGCDFVRRVGEAREVVRLVDHPGCAVQLDAGVFAMEDDDPADIRSSAGDIAHFHASAPFLEPVGGNLDAIGRLADALTEQGYRGAVSIEMRAGTDNAPLVARAVDMVRGRVEGTASRGAA